MGSISIREHIRWLPDAASEPTSTVVLTSPGRRFVDLRVLRPDGDTSWAGQKDALPVDRLEWGIAGTSSSWLRPDGQGGQVRRSQWRHWIDSRTSRPEEATDEGDMFPREDGTTLETGSMVNPDTGRETDYEELWRDVDPEPVAEGDAVRCVVLQYEKGGGRAEVVRLGRHCQGILREEGGAVTAERWEWEEKGDEKGWKRSVRMGEAELACEKVLDDGLAVQLGEELEIGGRTWKVAEVSGYST